MRLNQSCVACAQYSVDPSLILFHDPFEIKQQQKSYHVDFLSYELIKQKKTSTIRNFLADLTRHSVLKLLFFGAENRSPFQGVIVGERRRLWLCFGHWPWAWFSLGFPKARDTMLPPELLQSNPIRMNWCNRPPFSCVRWSLIAGKSDPDGCLLPLEFGHPGAQVLQDKALSRQAIPLRGFPIS